MDVVTLLSEQPLFIGTHVYLQSSAARNILYAMTPSVRQKILYKNTELNINELIRF